MEARLDWCTYGSILFLHNGSVAQALGLREGEYCVVMPKYVLCHPSGTPWRRPGSGLCRIIRGYGPRGLEKAVELSRVREVYSPLHGAMVPAVLPWDVQLLIGPEEALRQAIRRGSWRVVATTSWVRKEAGVPVESLGLTGSIAGGYSHEHSDVDMIALGAGPALRLYKLFRETSETLDIVRKEELGGLVVSPFADIGWRRLTLHVMEESFGVTWVGARTRGDPPCPPLERRQLSTPEKKFEGLLHVEPGQVGALLYPPCVLSREGVWIVSYEYNVGGLLFEGGRFYIEAMASGDGSAVFLGTREEPGKLILL